MQATEKDTPGRVTGDTERCKAIYGAQDSQASNEAQPATSLSGNYTPGANGRADIHFKLTCANCGNLLEVEADSKKTRMHFHSAFNAEAVMAIKPCSVCYAEAQRPLKLLREALGGV